jgi:hypothetical protein
MKFLNIFRLFERNQDKIHLYKNGFYYLNQRLPLNSVEEHILRMFFINGSIDLDDVLKELPVQKHISNVNRDKYITISNLNSKLQGFLWTKDNIISKSRKLGDKRKYVFKINEKYFQIQ